MNLHVLKRSRGSISRGDIFVMQLCSGDFLFGRVIDADIPRERAPMPAVHLIYIYRDQFATQEPKLESLRPERLLIPPVFTNRLGWTKGYFETVATQPIASADLLRQHCFRTWNGRFLDLDGTQLASPTDPCGDWALTSYRMIDDMISDALRIPRAPGLMNSPRAKNAKRNLS